ncbi:MAG: hypothetical protein ABGY11_02615 [Candidatus Thioglobus sp.]|jgi:hypothetical protein
MNKLVHMMPHGKIEVTKGEQFVWDWQYRSLGGFKSKLADCISHADTGNQKKLVKAFPEEAQAIIDFQSKQGYWESVERKIEAREAHYEAIRELKKMVESL